MVFRKAEEMLCTSSNKTLNCCGTVVPLPNFGLNT